MKLPQSNPVCVHRWIHDERACVWACEDCGYVINDAEFEQRQEADDRCASALLALDDRKKMWEMD